MYHVCMSHSVVFLSRNIGLLIVDTITLVFIFGQSKYPVALIDMFNNRMRCNNPSPKAGLTMTLMLKPSHVKLHLVDFHRQLFYDRIEQYDVFVYTEVSDEVPE